MEELMLLKNYASVITTAKDQCFFFIFSKGGFTEGLKKTGNEGGVTLITLEDMYHHEA